MSLILRCDHSELRRIRPWLDSVTHDLDDVTLGEIELAVHEVAANIIDHGVANPRVAGDSDFPSPSDSTALMLRLDQSPRRLRVQLCDEGHPAVLPGDDDLDPHPRVRGYGMIIVSLLASNVRYERSGESNVWTVDFALRS